MVYVLNIHGEPLMPCKPAKARHLLRDGKAKVIKRTPFSIQLLFECDDIVQEVALGVDAGSKTIGLSATTKDKELYASNVQLRNDIVEVLSTRRQNRRTRRSRLRYRQARFNNRVHSKHKGWLAPSIENKINTHLQAVSNVHKILPISKIIVETASFDIQKIKNPEIRGIEYQHGEQLDSWNVREYVLFRDGHTCQCCKGKSGDNILNTHHLESRKTGGNAPNNLITLCKTCHRAYHQGKVDIKVKRGTSFRDATFMGIMRWTFYNRLKELYPDVFMTFGYITKNTRIKNNLQKEHYVDARCISGNPLAEPLNHCFLQKKVRCHNRQIHKAKIFKGGIKRNNQAPYVVKGFCLYDIVKAKDKLWYIHGRRLKGSFVLKTLSGLTLEIAPSKIQFISHQKHYLIEISSEVSL